MIYCIKFKTEEESRLLQELAFANGYFWRLNEKSYADYGPWLYFDNREKRITWTGSYYKYAELSVELMIKFIKNEYNPVKTLVINGKKVEIIPNQCIRIGDVDLTDKQIQEIMTIYKSA